MKHALIVCLAILASWPAQAEIFNYTCKDSGKSFPLTVDDKRNTLRWKGISYQIEANEDCAKFGWRAKSKAASFDFCTATQGYASVDANGASVPCKLNQR